LKEEHSKSIKALSKERNDLNIQLNLLKEDGLNTSLEIESKYKEYNDKLTNLESEMSLKYKKIEDEFNEKLKNEIFELTSKYECKLSDLNEDCNRKLAEYHHLLSNSAKLIEEFKAEIENKDMEIALKDNELENVISQLNKLSNTPSERLSEPNTPLKKDKD